MKLENSFCSLIYRIFFMFEKTFKNLNWSIVGLQTLVVVICMKIAEMAWLDRTSEAILLPSCQIMFAIMIWLFVRTKIRGPLGSLEIFIGGTIGLFLVNQQFNPLAIGVSLIAIWLLEQNESKPHVLPEKYNLWTTIVLLVFAFLVWHYFGNSSLKWIITVLLGWIFQMSCQLNKPYQWNTSGDLWHPVKMYAPKLWIVHFTIANLGLLGLTILNGGFNLALILVVGKIIQKDKLGRWFSITRVIAIFLVVLPEILQNILQFLLQYY
jgi:hypothetical protein